MVVLNLEVLVPEGWLCSTVMLELVHDALYITVGFKLEDLIFYANCYTQENIKPK